MTQPSPSPFTGNWSSYNTMQATDTASQFVNDANVLSAGRSSVNIQNADPCGCAGLKGWDYEMCNYNCPYFQQGLNSQTGVDQYMTNTNAWSGSGGYGLN